MRDKKVLFQTLEQSRARWARGRHRNRFGILGSGLKTQAGQRLSAPPAGLETLSIFHEILMTHEFSGVALP